MTDDPQPPDAPPLNTPHCAECDAPLDPDQRYCLECGAPTSRAPRLAAARSGAKILALALILLALGTGFLAVAVTRENHSSNTGGIGTSTTSTSTTETTGTGTQTGFETVTSGTTTSTPTTSTTSTTTSTTTTPITSTTTTSTPTTSTTAPTASSWPPGTQAWTVILASVKTQSSADRIAARASSDGFSAGVLYSSAYSTLSPGYWVVFSGQYASSADATAAATSARSDFPGANARFIPASS